MGFSQLARLVGCPCSGKTTGVVVEHNGPEASKRAEQNKDVRRSNLVPPQSAPGPVERQADRGGRARRSARWLPACLDQVVPKGAEPRRSQPDVWGTKLGERLPFADADGSVGRDVLPPSSFQPLLLPRGRDPGAFGAVAPGAGSHKVLQAGGAALGPWIKVVTVLGGTATAAAEPHLQFTAAAGPRHPLAALLATEAPDGVPASDIPAVDDGGQNAEHHDGQAGKRDRGNDPVEQRPQNLPGRGGACPRDGCSPWHQCGYHGEGEPHHPRRVRQA